jgi:hypothetical protein
MSVDQIAISIPRTTWQEGSAFTATAYCRTRASAAAATPTTLKYRIDCLTTGREIADWTTLSAASSASISVTGAHNAIQDDSNDSEVRQLTVMADDGLSTQHRGSVRWRVENLYGSP